MALLAAWSGAFQVISPTIAGSYLLKFNGFPIVLSGFLLGPAGGFWCGALSDILAFMLKPGGPYIPFFTITSGITGALPVLIYQHLARKPEGESSGGIGSRSRQSETIRLSPWLLLLSIGLGQAGTKVLLVTALRAVLFGLPAKVLALRALLEQAVHVPLYSYAVWVVLRRVVLRGRPESPLSALRWEAYEARGLELGFDPVIGPEGLREL